MAHFKRWILDVLFPTPASLDRTDIAIFGVVTMFCALGVLMAVLFVISRYGFFAEIDACGRVHVEDLPLSIMHGSAMLMMACAPFSWVMLASRFNLLTLLFVVATGFFVAAVYVDSAVVIGFGCFSVPSRTF